MADETKVGVVFSYFSKAGVAALKLDKTLKVGDTIHLKGATTDFTQTVDSMQMEHEKVEKASKGQEVGIKVTERVRQQ